MQTLFDRLASRNSNYLSNSPQRYKDKRGSFAVELRKRSRVESQQNQRLINGFFTSAPHWILSEYPEYRDFEFPKKLQLIHRILTEPNEDSAKYNAIIALRMLTSEHDSEITHFTVSLGFIGILKGFLGTVTDERVLIEVAICFCGLCWFSEYTDLMLQSEILESLQGILNRNRPILTKYIAWATGNLCGNSAKVRKRMYKIGLCQDLMNCIETKVSGAHPASVSTISWVLSNLAKSLESQEFSIISSFIKTSQVLLDYDNEDITQDVLFIVAYIANCGDRALDALYNVDLLSFLVRYLGSSCWSNQIPAVLAIGNIVSKSSEFTDVLLNFQLLNQLLFVVNSTVERLAKESLFICSNIAAGTQSQRSRLLSHEVCGLCVRQLKVPQYSCQKEASYLLRNFGFLCSSAEILQLCSPEVLRAVSGALEAADTEIVRNLLIFIEAALRTDSQQVLCLISDSGCLAALERLQTHKNEEVSEQCSSLIVGYFGTEGESFSV